MKLSTLKTVFFIGLAAGILCYLIGAFVTGDFNSGHWEEWAKTWLVFLWLTGWAAGASILHGHPPRRY